MTTEIKEGWVMLGGVKFHYMRGGRSLCCRWAFLGTNDMLDADNGKPHSKDCKTCRKMLDKEKAV